MDIGDSERIMKVYQVKLFATISLFRWNGNVSWRKKKTCNVARLTPKKTEKLISPKSFKKFDSLFRNFHSENSRPRWLCQRVFKKQWKQKWIQSNTVFERKLKKKKDETFCGYILRLA